MLEIFCAKGNLKDIIIFNKRGWPGGLSTQDANSSQTSDDTQTKFSLVQQNPNCDWRQGHL